jgi:polyhydroxyalkanoate synthesis regulator phasin
MKIFLHFFKIRFLCAVQYQLGRVSVDNDQPSVETLATGAPEPVLMWDQSSRSKGLNRWGAFHGTTIYLALIEVFLLLTGAALPSHGRDKDVLTYGEGLIVNIPLPEPEVAQVVEDVAGNTIIRGTKEYDKDEFVKGALAATSTRVFPEWTEGGKVFYKVKIHTLDPRNFKNSGDLGTLAVRYVVQVQGFENTVLRVDAVFVEDIRHTVHLSNGSVESNEYADIHERLEAVELMKKETAEALRAKQDRLAKENFGLGSDTVVLSTPPPETSNSMEQGMHDQAVTPDQPQSLEQHVAELRRQVERLVKKPGAPLKSAPFHTASTLQSLNPGAEVLIQIATPYWYGVETHDGQHGWMQRDQLEQVP